MVQEKSVTLITLLAYFLVLACTIAYAYYNLALDAGNWIQLFILLIALGVFMLEGLGQILRALKQSKLKIIDSRTETRNKGTEGEFKDIYFVIENVGGQQAEDCKIKTKVKRAWQDSCSLSSGILDIYPHDKKDIRLCQVVKSSREVEILCTCKDEKFPPLEIGETYEIEIEFYCRNFNDQKIHRLKLDLSSWNNIGIRLDC